jgi:hypothetical protein
MGAASANGRERRLPLSPPRPLTSKSRRISDLSASERQQLEASLPLPIDKRAAIKKEATIRAETIISGALWAALGAVQAGNALLTILKHRMPVADAEAFGLALVTTAIRDLEKAAPAVPKSDDEDRNLGTGDDSTTPLKPNDGGTRQATGGQEHHSRRQPGRPKTKRWQTGPWRHLGAVHPNLALKTLAYRLWGGSIDFRKTVILFSSNAGQHRPLCFRACCSGSA